MDLLGRIESPRHSGYNHHMEKASVDGDDPGNRLAKIRSAIRQNRDEDR
jgi:hypothetical protein